MSAAQMLMKLNEEITIGSQPSLDDLKQLQQDGYCSIINFREDGEAGAALSPHEEGMHVREMGMEYLHVPVSLKKLRPEVVGQLLQRFQFLSKPVYAHCQGGQRAAAMMLTEVARQNRWNGEETLKKANELGIVWSRPELPKFVKTMINNQTLP